MNDKKHQIEGITLHAFDFKEYDRIVTVFSEEMGVISLIVKGANRKKKGTASALATPLSCGEFIFSAGKGDLFTYRDGTIYDQFLSLRHDFDTLDTAGSMLQITKKTLLPNKPAPLLYRLLKTFLSGLSDCSPPENALISFKLKMLHHEGLLPLGPDAVYDCGEVVFSDEERQLIFCLAASRSLKQITSLYIPYEFSEKISYLFEYTIASQ